MTSTNSGGGGGKKKRNSGRKKKGNPQAKQLAAADKGVKKGAPKVEVVTVCEELVNVITPVIEGDELVLLHTDFVNPGETTLSHFNVSVHQSNPGHAPANLGVEITYGGEIACEVNGAAFASGDTGGAAFRLDMRGVTQGDCVISARITGNADPRWRFEDTPPKTVLVENLRLDAFLYRDGRTVDAGRVNNLAAVDPHAAGTPKTRELHKRNDGIFTFARFGMRAPRAAFWDKAERITFSTNAGPVETYSNPAATVQVLNINAGNFNNNISEFRVATTGAVGNLPGEPGGRIQYHNYPVKAPEKQMTDCYVSCGATVRNTNRELLLGDLVKLQAFSFDDYLDRNVYNECRTRVLADNADAANHVAVAKAAAHKYYDNESGFCRNYTHYPGGWSAFKPFIKAIHGRNCIERYYSNGQGRWIDPVAGRGSAAQAATRGANFIQTYLLDEHAIALHNTTKGLLRTHILNELVTNNGWNQGLDNYIQAPVGGDLWAPYGFSLGDGAPGTHAEVLAVNEMIAAGVPAAEITVATYMLKSLGRQGKRFVACYNCDGILGAGNVRVITD
ncbi:MAG: hypothetical protein ACJA2X_000893 [Halocynthiibacter sp.]|jgi:hypothetical protein